MALTDKIISKRSKRLLNKYKEDYIEAVKSQLEIYKKHKVASICPMCAVAKYVMDNEVTKLLPDSINATCSHCLWYLLEPHRICTMWLVLEAVNHDRIRIISFDDIIGKSSNKEIKEIRNKRIKMLEEWMNYLENLQHINKI